MPSPHILERPAEARLTRRLPLPGIAMAVVLAACTSGVAPTPAPPTTAPPTGQNATNVPASAAPAPVGIRVGLIGSFSSVRAAEVLGQFDEAGLNVEINNFRGGAEAAQALAGGSLEIFVGDITHAVNLTTSGHEVRVIGGATSQHAYTLVGRRDGPTSLEELRGAKIGITSPGSQTDHTVRYLLEREGLDPNQDAELVGIGAGPPMQAALENGQVDAGMVFEPFTTVLLEAGYPLVYDIARDLQPFEGTVFIAPQSFLDANEGAARRFLQAVIGAIEELQTDAEARSTVGQAIFPDLDSEVVEQIVENYVEAMDHDGRFEPEAVETVLEVSGRDTAEVNLDEITDFGYLP